MYCCAAAVTVLRHRPEPVCGVTLMPMSVFRPGPSDGTSLPISLPSCPADRHFVAPATRLSRFSANPVLRSGFFYFLEECCSLLSCCNLVALRALLAASGCRCDAKDPAVAPCFARSLSLSVSSNLRPHPAKASRLCGYSPCCTEAIGLHRLRHERMSLSLRCESRLRFESALQVRAARRYSLLVSKAQVMSVSAYLNLSCLLVAASAARCLCDCLLLGLFAVVELLPPRIWSERLRFIYSVGRLHTFDQQLIGATARVLLTIRRLAAFVAQRKMHQHQHRHRHQHPTLRRCRTAARSWRQRFQQHVLTCHRGLAQEDPL